MKRTLLALLLISLTLNTFGQFPSIQENHWIEGRCFEDSDFKDYQSDSQLDQTLSGNPFDMDANSFRYNTLDDNEDNSGFYSSLEFDGSLEDDFDVGASGENKDLYVDSPIGSEASLFGFILCYLIAKGCKKRKIINYKSGN